MFKKKMDKDYPVKVQVKVQKDSILLEPSRMEIGRFYFAELNGRSFLYRKVSENEIEVYERN